MRATRLWHCACCDAAIKPGDEMHIVAGDILADGHSIDHGIDLVGSYFSGGEMTCEPKHITKPAIKTEQQTLDIQVKRAWDKYERSLPEQQPIADLPLFNLDAQHTEQLSLF